MNRKGFYHSGRSPLAATQSSFTFVPIQDPRRGLLPNGTLISDRYQSIFLLESQNDSMVFSSDNTRSHGIFASDNSKSFGNFSTPSPPPLLQPAVYPTNSDFGNTESTSTKTSRLLTPVMVFGINYFLVCGGPTGSEPAAAAGGPLVGLIAVLLYPLLFSLPIAFVVAELCTALPDDGGFVLWANNAFGPFWGFQQGYWEWVSNVLCNALYPIAIFSAATSAYGDITSPIVTYMIKATIAMVMSLPTLFGVRAVSYTSLLLSVLVLLPWMAFVILSFAHAKHFDYLTEVRHANVTMVDTAESSSAFHERVTIEWSKLFSTVFWCYDGIYLISLFGGQVRHPSSTFPVVIFGSLAAAMVGYFVSLAATVVIGLEPWSQFDENATTTVAGMLGGETMRNFLVFTSICSNAGLFSSATFSCSYQLNGMAACGLLPASFAQRHYFFETPYISVLANAFPVLFLLAFDFEVLLDASNAFSAFVQIMIIFAAIKLRVSHPTLHRPTKVPGGIVVFVLIMFFPMAVLGFVIYSAFDCVASTLIVGGFVACGALYGACSFTHRQRRLEIIQSIPL